MNKNVCPKCGKEVEEDFAVCPYCGESLHEEQKMEDVVEVKDEIAIEPKEEIHEEHKEEISETNDTQKEVKKFGKNKKIIAAVVAVVAVVAIAFGVKSYTDKKAHEAYVKEYNEYVTLVKTTQINMLTGAAQAETISNQISKVWSNAIWEKDDAETDAYTKVNGVFVEDFNTALSNYFSSSEALDIVINIQSSQSSVEKSIKKLKNAPEGLEEHKEVIMDLYDAYKDFTNFATDPSGSLTTFRQEVKDLDSDFMSEYDNVDDLDLSKIK